MKPANQPGEVNARLARLITRQAQKRHLASFWAERAGIGPGSTVLDIGAGTGALALEYAAMVQPGGRVIALDPDTECLDHAASEAARLGLKLQTLAGHAGALPTLPSMPDIVVMSDTLHHIGDKPEALRAIRGVMKPSSRLFIAEYDPDGPGLHGAPRAMRLASADTEILLRAVGLRAISIAPGPDEHYTVLAGP